MKTCKDCIHYEACHRKDREIPANTCRTFKDKSLVLDLPCKVGETLYLVQIDFAGNYFMTAIVVSSKITMLSILRAYEEKTIIYMSTDKNQAEEELQARKERVI